MQPECLLHTNDPYRHLHTASYSASHLLRTPLEPVLLTVLEPYLEPFLEPYLYPILLDGEEH